LSADAGCGGETGDSAGTGLGVFSPCDVGQMDVTEVQQVVGGKARGGLVVDYH
jgi:hypothetical protein